MRLILAATVAATARRVARAGRGQAQTTDEEAKRAAQEIQAARDRANAGRRRRSSQAQSDLEALEDRATRAGPRGRTTSNGASSNCGATSSHSPSRGSPPADRPGIPLLTGLQPPKDQVQAEVLGGVVNNAGTERAGRVRRAPEGTRHERRERRRPPAGGRRSKQEVFTQLQAEAEAEVVRLREIEEQRLTDVAVRRALAAQQAAEPIRVRRGDPAQRRSGGARPAEPRRRGSRSGRCRAGRRRRSGDGRCRRRRRQRGRSADDRTARRRSHRTREPPVAPAVVGPAPAAPAARRSAC